MPDPPFQIESINVGMPVEVTWHGKTVRTGIYKSPVQGRLRVDWLNLEGDKQADLQVHGGRDKAIYAYACEHYEFWQKELPGMELPWGSFGENLSVSGGLFEDRIGVGDRFRLGTAEIVAVQPRLPCYKLGIRFGTQTTIKRFLRAGRFGIYFRVVRRGIVQAGDALELMWRANPWLSISDLAAALTANTKDVSLIEQAIRLDALPERLRSHFLSALGR